jgi:hypothetical protein
MSLLPRSTFQHAQKYKANTTYITKLNQKYDNAVQKECSVEIEAYNKAVSTLQNKMKTISQTSAHKEYVRAVQKAEQDAFHSLFQIEKDARKCINSIQTNESLNTEEKKKQINEISDLIAQAIMDKDDYNKLKEIQQQLTGSESRIVILQ